MKMNCEKEAVTQMALEILVAAKTAPKGKGIDNLVTYLLDKDDIKKLADEMEKQSEKRGAFYRDADNLKESDSVVIIGLKDSQPLGLNCGACGFETCADFKNVKKMTKTPFSGPICSLKSVDLGIAIGSAASKAKDLCLDNRIIYSVGATACLLKMIEAECAYAIPLSVSGKSPYFERTEQKKVKEIK